MHLLIPLVRGPGPTIMRTSLSLKINTILLLVVLSLGGALGAFFIIDQRGTIRGALDRRIQIMGGYLSRSIEKARFRNDVETIDRLLLAATLDREIAYIMVKSPAGDILAARWQTLAAGDVSEYAFPLYEAKSDRDEPATLFESVLHRPASGERIGTLAIGVDVSLMNAELARQIRWTAGAILLATAACWVAGYCFVRILLARSLSPLIAGIQAIGAGNLFRRIEPDRHREIAEIGKAFNQMAERLSSSLISREQLEATVEQRTAELQVALHDRIRAQSELAEREERIRQLLDSTAEAIYGIDMDGLCTFCNPACLRMLGYEHAEDLIGKNMHAQIHHSRPNGASYAVEACPIYEAFRTGKGTHVLDEVFWKKDGSSFNVEYWSYPVRKGPFLQGAVVTFLDITERIKLERQFVQAQKLEGIGVLAGGIAHDFNNLLVPIMGYTDIAMRQLGEGHPARKSLQTVKESAQRAAELTRQILAFSRKQVLQMKVLNLNDEVLSAAKMIGRLIGEDIDVRLTLAADLPAIKADPTQMQQVLLNLAVNARDAMPGGGRLTIETGVARTDGVRFWTERELQPGRYILMTVSDTGSGMDEATRRHLFEPFFTTKEAGKGTGLGLSTVHGIVKQHGGDISVYSERGHGTAFRIYLPCSEEAATEENAAKAASHPRGSGTVLLVEDDKVVRDFVGMVLGDFGYTVTAATGEAEALEAARRSAFDLIVTDVIMPGVNGREVVRSINKLRPGTRVLYFSGYPAGAGALQNIFEGGEPFLQKPFTVEALLQKVREIMTAPPPEPA